MNKRQTPHTGDPAKLSFQDHPGDAEVSQNTLCLLYRPERCAGIARGTVIIIKSERVAGIP